MGEGGLRPAEPASPGPRALAPGPGQGRHGGLYRGLALGVAQGAGGSERNAAGPGQGEARFRFPVAGVGLAAVHRRAWAVSASSLPSRPPTCHDERTCA